MGGALMGRALMGQALMGLPGLLWAETPPRTLPDPPTSKAPPRTPQDPSETSNIINFYKKCDPQAPQEDFQGPLRMAVSVA